MIEIVTPQLAATRDVQESQGRYYWSRCADVLFRQAGIISVRRTSQVSSSPGLKIFCREVLVGAQAAENCAAVIEGPLSASFLMQQGISAFDVTTAALWLDGAESMGMLLPEIRVRKQDRSLAVLSHPASDQKWDVHPLSVQFLSGVGWEPVLYARCGYDGPEGAVALRKDGMLVFGFSFLDVLVRWLAFPPLAERYGGFARLISHEQILDRLLAVILDHGKGLGVPSALRVDRWPEGFAAALTIRHDYDRPAPLAELKRLLDCYDELGVRASVGFLPYLLDLDVMRAFRDRGHEVQAHLSSPSRADLRDDISLLRFSACAPIKGLTIHGGPQGIGFRGATHFDWFDDVGLEYCETFGPRSGVPVPLVRVFDGVPDRSFLVAAPSHMSLDGSTRPDDHRLLVLKESVPRALRQADYVIVMNHPDVHRDQLVDLLRGLRLQNVWRPTTLEAIEWFRTTRYGSCVEWHPAGYVVSFPTPLSQPATFRVGTAHMTIQAGCATAFVPLCT